MRRIVDLFSFDFQLVALQLHFQFIKFHFHSVSFQFHFIAFLFQFAAFLVKLLFLCPLVVRPKNATCGHGDGRRLTCDFPFGGPRELLGSCGVTRRRRRRGRRKQAPAAAHRLPATDRRRRRRRRQPTTTTVAAQSAQFREATQWTAGQTMRRRVHVGFYGARKRRGTQNRSDQANRVRLTPGDTSYSESAPRF